jgi:hypothetical protein
VGYPFPFPISYFQAFEQNPQRKEVYVHACMPLKNRIAMLVVKSKCKCVGPNHPRGKEKCTQ